MAGHTLNTSATLMCPHGGTVTIVPSSTRVKAGGAPLALATDTFVVAGCPFQIPAVVPIPSPCVTVRWTLPDLRNVAGKVRTLSESSVGLCLSGAQIPQGPVVISMTQQRAKSQ